ncbi:MAG: hypothetical protein LC789_16705 [Actinobacteria bacterium]|nr:hypothetical protein [Actinomycetota bacterium]
MGTARTHSAGTPPQLDQVVTEELRRRARVMAIARAVITVLVPAEMLLYQAPPGITSQLHPVRASLWVVAVLVATTAASLWRHRTCDDPRLLRGCGRAELAVDALVALGILQVFSFDPVSSIWTILVVIGLEAAFREGLRGALVAWALSSGRPRRRVARQPAAAGGRAAPRQRAAARRAVRGPAADRPGEQGDRSRPRGAP